MRRRTLLGALPLLLWAPEALAHPPRQPDSAEATKVSEEVTDFRARLAKDFAALRPLYADSFTHTHGSGKLDNKDARLVAAMAGEPLIEAALATDLTFRVFAGPTVIVTGKSPILNVKEQKTYDFRWVCVYVTAQDGWQLAVSQATRLS
jgi:hypothetical protein